MKKVTYKTLKIQNFLSVGNDTVMINFQNGLNLITGKNIDNPDRKNAIGKSAMIEGFYYALFGSTIRKIKKDYVVNNVTKGKGNIELEFDVKTDSGGDSYKIQRQVKPSKVTIFKNGEDITESTINNNKEFIMDLLGTNPTLCKSCDILSLSDNTPFMGMDAKDKRKFIEDIFSLEVFGSMVKDLKTLISKNKTDEAISSAKIEEIQNSINTIHKQAESFKKQQEERVANLKIKRENLEKSIDTLKNEISSYDIPDVTKSQDNKLKLDEAYSKLESVVSDLNQRITENKTNKRFKSSELDKMSKVGGASCDKCLQKISEDHISHIEEMKGTISSEIKEYDSLIEEDAEKLLKIRDKQKLIRSKCDELTSIIEKSKMDTQKLSNLKDRLEQQKESLTDLKDTEDVTKSPVFDKSLKDTEDRKIEESKNFSSLREHSDDLNVCKFILGEEGVKSFVVKKLIGMLNSSIQGYINDLGMTMRCEFDEYFDERMSNENGQEISYWNLSGGERRTVDLACSWSFKDIKRKISGISSNVEFLDEYVDGCFDERGVDLLIEMIKKRADKFETCVYCVSHRSETSKHVDGEIVELEKENKITRRVN